jgi:hypothetical protein
MALLNLTARCDGISMLLFQSPTTVLKKIGRAFHPPQSLLRYTTAPFVHPLRHAHPPLSILIAQQPTPPNIHHIRDGRIRDNPAHIQDMSQCRHIPRIARGLLEWRRQIRVQRRARREAPRGGRDLGGVRADGARQGRSPARRGDVDAADLGEADGQVELLPFPPELVEPGVVQVEERVAGGGDGVEEL